MNPTSQVDEYFERTRAGGTKFPIGQAEEATPRDLRSAE